jgi:hypothetical protein
MKVGAGGITNRLRRARWLAIGLAGALALAGCGNGDASPRPTDPRQILVTAIGRTAAVPTLRLHIEVASDMGGGALGGIGQPRGVMTMGVDADVDLATRQFTGRATTTMPAGIVGNGVPAQQVADVIVTTTATFTRSSSTGRWSKVPAGMGGGFGGGPTNEQIATMLSNLLSNPSVTYELGEASSCTLGTCDHVVAHIDGQSLGAALGPLLGAPIDAAGRAAIPSFDVDVLVDQATSVISELRTTLSMQGVSARILISTSNPGQPVQIVPPPPALTDDLGQNFGGGGIGPDATILEEVGNELSSAEPGFPAPSAQVP